MGVGVLPGLVLLFCICNLGLLGAWSLLRGLVLAALDPPSGAY